MEAEEGLEAQCSLTAKDDTEGPIRNTDNQSGQPIRSPPTPLSSRRLVRALINKRDYLRTQVRNFQQNFTGFRFMRRKVTKEDGDQSASCCHDDEDLKDFVTIETTDCEIQDGCQSDNMAVKRRVEKRVTGDSVTQASSMEGGGGQCVLEGGNRGASSPTKSTGHASRSTSLADVKTWSDLMNTLSPKKQKDDFQDEPMPEVTKADDDAFVDDLPLGSEGFNYQANTLSVVTSAESSVPIQPPLDSRLASLRGSPGHFGWSSFHSEVSAQTSGSSANSLDILLSQRNVDPEHMLRSLGFGYVQEQEPAMLRIPLRFMQRKSCANGIDIEEFLEEYPELQRLVMKKSHGTVKWQGLRKSLTIMAAMKSLPARNNAATAAASALSSHHVSNSNIPGSLPVMEEDDPAQIARHSSILIPENQRALASQGFYDIDVVKREKTDSKRCQSEGSKSQMDAASRRAQYGKAKSKRWSLVEPNEDHTVGESSDAWMSQSLDDSRGRYSGTDFSSSMDSSDSPVTNSRTSSISEKRRVLEEQMMKHSTEGIHLGSISKTREQQVGMLMDDDDEDGKYSVSPVTSKQSTIEKASTLDAEEESEKCKHVRIVVSDTDPGNKDVPDRGVGRIKAPNTQSLLTIVSAQIERLSDSGSDHTLVDSPRPSVDTGMSRPVLGQTISKDSVFEDSDKTDKHVSVSCQTSIDNYQLDENDNHSATKSKTEGPGGKQNQDDLPRMASVQSDSSGFGDADNTGDVGGLEIEKSWVSSLGSSGESAGTLASSNTTVLVHDVATDIATQTSLSEHTNSVTNKDNSVSLTPSTWETTLSNNASRAATSDKSVSKTVTESQPSRYISTCYIPPVRKVPVSSIIKQNSGATVSGQGLVLGKTRVSVIVPNTSQSSSDIPDSKMEQKSFLKPLFIKRGNVPSYDHPRAPLAQPEEYESDETDGRESYLSSHSVHSGKTDERKSEVSVLNLRLSDNREFGSRISLAEDSDYSCSSVADSTASCSTSEILDYRKLVRLINQPVNYRGRRRSIIRYRPKRQIRDWPNLFKKKRIQEETRLLQHAVQKYKTELHLLETSCLLQYQVAYEDLSEEEREEVEELQGLWQEVREQLQNVEMLLSHRMKSVNKGNDFFSYLSSLNVVHRMTELLKEQMYQQTVSASLEQEEEEENEEDEEERRSHSSFTHSSPNLPVFSPAQMSGYGSPFGMFGDSRHQDSHQSMEEMRRSLMDEMKQELNRSTQQLYLDLQAKDNEIQRLNLEMMMQSGRSPRKSRSSLPHRRSTRQTDV